MKPHHHRMEATSRLGKRAVPDTEKIRLLQKHPQRQPHTTPPAWPMIAIVAAMLSCRFIDVQASDLPTGGQVAAGAGSISQAGNTLTVTQTTQNMVANWQSFSVAAGHTVNFVQPSAQAAVLNRVLGADVSIIQGAINANGRVFLVNPNGVLFTPSAQVNVGSLIASTLSLATEDFMNGNYRFEGHSSNAVINQGNITAVGDGQGGGTVALLAAKISNSGSLAAHKGQVLMGAGQRVLLDLGGPVKLEVQQAAIDALIEQGGVINAPGGLVYLTAKSAANLAASVINHTGVTQARTLQSGEQGQIFLLGDMQNDRLNIGGVLDASAPEGGNGGFIETSAATVIALDNRLVSTLASEGTHGTYLIDPNDYTIAASGADITGAQLGLDLSNGNVIIQSVNGATNGNGDIFVNDAVSWNSATRLTLQADRNIRVNADISAQHNNSQVAFHYNQSGEDASAGYFLSQGAKVNLQAGNNFFTKQGPTAEEISWTVITALGSPGSTTATDLQGINGALAGNYVLGADIDASATSLWNNGNGFTPLSGYHTNQFNGRFDGLGHHIKNIRITPSATGGSGTSYVGLFGKTGAASVVRNIGLQDAYIYHFTESSTGGLVGQNYGSIDNSYVTGTVRGNTNVGGLAGHNYKDISGSYFSGSVSAGNRAGGLVGMNFNPGSIVNSYATGNTSINGPDYVGGLVAYNTGNIRLSYSSAIVNNNDNRAPNETQSGRLVGQNLGTLQNSYWNAGVSGSMASSAGVGAGTATGALALDGQQFKQSSSFTGFDFDSVWYAQNGSSAPLLRSHLKPLVISAKNTSKTYDAQVYNSTSGLAFSLQNVDQSQLLGALNFGSVSETAPDAGTYSISAAGLYSSQLGYAISYGPSATLTVNPAAITLTGSRNYDGTNVFTTDLLSNGGLVNGVGGQTLSLSGEGLVASKNVQPGNAYQILNTSTLALGNGTGKASNYTLEGAAHTGQITTRPVTVSGTQALDKTYDGTRTASIVAGNINNLVGDEGLTLVADARFADSNVGNHQVTVAYTLQNGESGDLASNYRLTGEDTSLQASITPRPVTVKANDATKLFQTADPTFTWGVVNGSVISGDTLAVSLVRNPGEGIGSYGIRALAQNASNYRITTQNGTLSIIPSPVPANDLSVQQRNAVQSATAALSGANQSFGSLAGSAVTPVTLVTAPSANGPSPGSGSSSQSAGLIFVPAEQGTSGGSPAGVKPVFVVGSGVNLGNNP